MTTNTNQEDKLNIRQERIERLLHELRYEVERGMIEREIDETMGYEFVVPISQAIPDGVVMCRFRTIPRPRHYALSIDNRIGPRLRIVK